MKSSRAWQFMVFAGMSIGTSFAQAQTWTESVQVVTGAGIQYKQLNMQQKMQWGPAAGNGVSKGDLTAYLPTLNLHFAALAGNYFSVLKFEKNILTPSEKSGIPFTNEDTPSKSDVARQDVGVTFGYQLDESVALFVGYMNGKTELKPDAYVPEADPQCLSDNNPRCNIAGELRINSGSVYRQSYQEKGPFLGASYAWKLNKGRLAASVAYASMMGQYKDNLAFTDQSNPEDADQSFRFEGKSKGLSMAINWTASLSDTVSYFVDARMQQYQMDAINKADSALFEGSTATTNERLTGITAGVQVRL